MSNPSRQLQLQIVAAGLPEPELEVEFARERWGRKWRADLCWPLERLIVEVDGGVYGGKPCPRCKQTPVGRHLRGRGYEEDCRKQAAATLLGYRHLKVTPRHIETGEALAWITYALNGS